MQPATIRYKKIILAVAMVLLAAFAAGVVLHDNPDADPGIELMKKIISVAVIALSALFLLLKYDKIVTLPMEIWQNRRLIVKLAANDFKRRYAGSYMGVIWAFVQPLVTILLYYFVFVHFAY